MTPTDATATTGLRDTLIGLLDATERLGAPSTAVRLGAAGLAVRSPRPEYLQQATDHSSGDAQCAPWPTLTVHLVDGEHLPATSIAPPLLPAPAGAGGQQSLFRDGAVLASTASGMLWILDRESRRALRWTPSPADLAEWEVIRPLRFALRTWAATHGGALLHAGAVVGRDGAALLVGPGGTGKSTTSMACLGTGLRVVADDYCLVRPLDGHPAVSPTYRLGLLDSRSLSMLPHLGERVLGVDERGKRIVPLDPIGGLEVPVRVVCTIGRGAPTRAERASRAAALRELAPSTLFQIAGTLAETWAAVSGLIHGVEAHHVHVAAPHEAPAVLADLLGGPA